MTILELDPPITVSGRAFVRYLDGHAYEDLQGVTVYSGAAEPSEADAADCIQNPRTPPTPSAPLSQSARVVLARLTPGEKTALRTCTVPAILDAYDVALIEGRISAADADFPAFRAGLDALGIIAASRWTALLAP